MMARLVVRSAAIIFFVIGLSLAGGCGPGDDTATDSVTTTDAITTTVATAVPTTVAPPVPGGRNPPYEGNLLGPAVAIVGDSLLTDDFAGLPLDALLRLDHQTSRVAQFGARADEMVATAQDWYDGADIAVVGLGANDSIAILRGTWTLPQTFEAFTELRDAFSQASCLVYVTIDESAPCFDCDVAAEINDWWRVQALLDAERIRIADWSTALNDAGGWEVWSSDGLHQTDDGRQFMAEVIASAVRSCR